MLIYKNKALVDFKEALYRIHDNNKLFEYPDTLNVYNKDCDMEFQSWCDEHKQEYADTLHVIHEAYDRYLDTDSSVKCTIKYKRAYEFMCVIGDFFYHRGKCVSKIDGDMIAFNLGSDFLTIRQWLGVDKAHNNNDCGFRELVLCRNPDYGMPGIDDDTFIIKYDKPDNYTYGDLCRLVSEMQEKKQYDVFNCYQLHPRTRSLIQRAMSSLDKLLKQDSTNTETARLFFKYLHQVMTNIRWAIEYGVSSK